MRENRSAQYPARWPACCDSRHLSASARDRSWMKRTAKPFRIVTGNRGGINATQSCLQIIEAAASCCLPCQIGTEFVVGVHPRWRQRTQDVNLGTMIDRLFFRRRPGALLATMLMSATLCPAAGAAVDRYKETREVFQRAYAGADSSPSQADEVDSERLRDYPLYPYLQAARLRRALLNTAESLESVDQRTATFLTYYEREPVAWDVRRAWMASLAARKQWPMFLQQYRDEAANDALRCQRLIARIELGQTEGLATDIAKQWLAPQSLPECEQPFAWLREHNALTPALIEQRARRALENGNTAFARQIIAQLPAQQAAPLSQWAALLENPQRGIDAMIG